MEDPTPPGPEGGEPSIQQLGCHAEPSTEGQQQEHAQDVEQQTPAWQNYSTVFTNAKPGMGGVDQQHVKQVVYEMSKGSAHFANEQRKQAQTDARIARLKAQAAQLNPAQLAAYQKSCDARITLLEAGRELDKVWLHVDMDAFYASVEERDQPALKDKPMAVGGMGMICTANYRARTYGVRSAMPGFIAKKLCPQLVFVKPDFSKYTAASAEAFAVFRGYDERVQGASLDEAYLDVTAHCSTHGMTGGQVAEELRARVVEATRGLTCSVGVAPNMMLAKIASDKNKPNGQCVVGATREEVLAFIADLPIRKIPGIGKVTEQTLQALGVSTCSDLITHAALLAALLSDISASSLLEAGLGLGATQHSSRGGGEGSSEPGRKGISCERTFGAISNAADMERMAESLVNHLASDMASEGIEAKTLTLKLKTTTFEVRTRAVTLPTYVSSAAAMLPPILRLLRAELPVSIRLMGVRGSNLRKAPQPLDQLAAEGRKLNALERLVLQGRQKQQQQEEGQGQQEAGGHEQQQQEEGANVGSPQQWQLGCEESQQQQQQQREEVRGVSELDWDDEVMQEVEGKDEADGDVGLLLQQHSPLPLLLPTQEQLQAEYEQRCRQQEQQELAAADMVDAAADGEEGGWAVDRPAAGQVGFDLPPLQREGSPQQWQQQQQHQGDGCRVEQPAGFEQQQTHQGGQQDCADAVDVQSNKRRRRSFSHPPQVPQHTSAAAAPVAAPAHHHQQQQQQQEELQQMSAGCHGSGWQTASALQQQQQQDQAADIDGQEGFAEARLAGAGDATTAAAAAGYGQAGSRGHAGSSSSSRHLHPRSSGVAPWTCLACTFSGNQQIWLRCSVCDTPKGDTAPTAAHLTASDGSGGGTTSSGRGAGLTARAAAAAGGGGRRGRATTSGAGRAVERAGGGGKQVTLEHLGLQKQPKG